MKSERVPCNLCGQERFTPVLTDSKTDFSQGFCSNCGLIYVNPRLDGPSRARFYATYGQKYPESFLMNRENPYLQIARKRAIFFKDFVRSLPDRPKTLMEVGCSYGFFLKELGEQNVGVATHGIDPSFTEVEFARRANGLSNVRTGLVGDLRGSRQRFDVIALFHVLEHLGDPVETLRIIHGVLKENGLIWVEVPDAGELKGDIIEFQHLVSCQHLYEFSQVTLRGMLEQAGFEEVVLEKAPLGFFLSSNQRAVFRKRKGGRVATPMRKDTQAQGYLSVFRDRIMKIREDVQTWFDEQERHGRPIYIYGGGFHTMGLLGLIELHNGSVRAILDDDSTKHGSSIEGLQVMDPTLLEEQHEVAIIVSTLVGEERILARLGDFRGPDWEIKTIYKDATT